jgi:uncharacterized protein (DUF2235 family)
MAGRRLLFFFDGTANTVGSPKDTLQTNLFRLLRSFTYDFDGVPQLTFYYSGVGTRGDTFSAATARGFDQIIAEAYINLAANYLDRDTIYVFGFSRGAAAARAFTGLLSDPGLVPADNLSIFPEIWKYFVSNPKTEQGNRAILKDKIESKLFYPQPSVEFLGAFDSVAGTSWDRGRLFSKVRFHGLKLDPVVKKAVQVLSIDDNRNPSFSPLLWNGKSNPNQVLEQIWLPGVHADIGGCSDGMAIGDIALLTIIDRIKKYCPELGLDDSFIRTVRNSLQNTKSLQITNERFGVLRKLLVNRPRRIGENPGETYGKLFDLVRGKKITVRGKEKIYELDIGPTVKLTSTRYDRDFERVVDRILKAS